VPSQNLGRSGEVNCVSRIVSLHRLNSVYENECLKYDLGEVCVNYQFICYIQ